MKLSYRDIAIDTKQLLIGQTEEVSKTISTFLNDNTIDLNQVVKVDLMIDINEKEDYSNTESNLQAVLSKLFGKQIPAYAISTSKILDKKDTCLLLSVCDDKNYKIEYKEFQKFPYTVGNKENIKTLTVGGISFNEDMDLLRSTQMAFDFAEQLLDHEEMHFGHVDFITAQFENSFLKQTSDTSASWNTVQQIKELYLDPELFNQDLPPFCLSTVNNGGITLSFSAAQKDTFPVHQSDITKYPGISTSVIKDWKQTKFCTYLQVDKDSNIILQTKELMNLMKETLSKANHSDVSELQFDLLKIHLKNTTDFEDAEIIIKEHLPAKEYIFVLSELQQPQSLIAIEGVVSF